MNDEQLRDALAALRDDPVPFESVRGRVLTRRRRPALWLWPAAAAAACAVLWMAAPRPGAEIAPPPLPVSAKVPATPIRRENPAAPAITPVRAVRRVEKAEAFTVKLVTDDPDVVIYWVVGGEGE